MTIHKPNTTPLIFSDTYLLKFTDPLYKMMQFTDNNEGNLLSKQPRHLDRGKSLSSERRAVVALFGHLGPSPSASVRLIRGSLLRHSPAPLPISARFLPKCQQPQGITVSGPGFAPFSCSSNPPRPSISPLSRPLCYKQYLIKWRHLRMLWRMMITSLMVTRHWEGRIKLNEYMDQLPLKCTCE